MLPIFAATSEAVRMGSACSFKFELTAFPALLFCVDSCRSFASFARSFSHADRAGSFIRNLVKLEPIRAGGVSFHTGLIRGKTSRCNAAPR